MSLTALRGVMCMLSVSIAIIAWFDQTMIVTLDHSVQIKLLGGECWKPEPRPCYECPPIPGNQTTSACSFGATASCTTSPCSMAMTPEGPQVTCPCFAGYQLQLKDHNRAVECEFQQGSMDCWQEVEQSSDTVVCAIRRACKLGANCMDGHCMDNGAAESITCVQAIGAEGLCPNPNPQPSA